MSPNFSVVMPVYNEAPHLPATVDALVEAVRHAALDAELVFVDDGSTDGSAEVAAAALDDQLQLSVVRQPNSGRFHAVREGLRRAKGRFVLVLGARVLLRPESLAFVRERQLAGDLVWTGHVHIDTAGNPFGTFQNVLTEIAWRDYFSNPRTVSFGLSEFDHYPKGSGCFVAPRELLLRAFDARPTRYADVRHANDDAPMLRRVAAEAPIHISPRFASDYKPRATLRTFVQHSIHRGSVFFDGHGRRESRFFPYVVVFYPLSAAVLAGSLRRPSLLPRAVGATAVAAGCVAAFHRRSRYEVAVVTALTPIWLGAFGAGLWRGLGMFAAGRLTRR